MGQLQVIPVRWMAPETIRYCNEMKFTVASDVWAYGVTVWEIYTYGETPYYSFNNADARKEIVRGLTLEIPETCPDSMKNIMRQCWMYDPHARCSFDQIVQIIEEFESEISQSQMDENELQVPFEASTDEVLPSETI